MFCHRLVRSAIDYLEVGGFFSLPQTLPIRRVVPGKRSWRRGLKVLGAMY